MVADDNDFIRPREFYSAVDKLKEAQSESREKLAGLEMSVLHQVQGVRSDVSEIKAILMRPPPPPPVDHGALAAQRAIDLLESKLSGPTGAGPNTLLIMFAILGAIAIGFIVARFITG